MCSLQYKPVQTADYYTVRGSWPCCYDLVALQPSVCSISTCDMCDMYV